MVLYRCLANTKAVPLSPSRLFDVAVVWFSSPTSPPYPPHSYLLVRFGSTHTHALYSLHAHEHMPGKRKGAEGRTTGREGTGYKSKKGKGEGEARGQLQRAGPWGWFSSCKTPLRVAAEVRGVSGIDF
jgi:hypothetical protein